MLDIVPFVRVPNGNDARRLQQRTSECVVMSWCGLWIDDALDALDILQFGGSIGAAAPWTDHGFFCRLSVSHFLGRLFVVSYTYATSTYMYRIATGGGVGICWRKCVS